MVQRTVTLQLGGKEETLLFGAMGYFTHVKDASGKDPFDFLNGIDEKRESGNNNQVFLLIEDIAVIIYAGLNSYLDSQDKPNVPIEKVKKWCNGLNSDEVSIVMKSAFGTLETPGELEPNQAQANGKA